MTTTAAHAADHDADRPAPRRRADRPQGTRRYLWLLMFLALTGAAAAIGGLASADSAEIYAVLDRPAFAPPAWLFGPAWTVLYLLIAVAGWLAFLRAGWDRALTLWVVQLVLNAAWTPIFFGAQMYWPAFADISVLWVLVAVCTVMLLRRRRLAGLLMAPYLAWVTYAGALNLAIAVMN